MDRRAVAAGEAERTVIGDRRAVNGLEVVVAAVRAEVIVGEFLDRPNRRSGV